MSGDIDTEIILNPSHVARIQTYMNDPVYRETIENAAIYNSRLSAERTMRLPWLDSQTGVAQNHSNLWMEARQRLPGLREGQIYSYPSKRWRKRRRQYLNNFLQPRYPHYPISIPRKEVVEEHGETQVVPVDTHMHNPASVGPSILNEDSRESTKDETAISKQEAWYYDDLDIPDAGEFDEPDADSDYDYEESYSKRKKKKPPAKSTRQTSTRGRRKITYDAVTDPEKPFSCDLCGARYKTRPGLTYHYTHSHKDKEEEDDEDAVSASPKRDDNSGRRHNRGHPGSLPPPILHPQHQHMQLQPPTLQPQQPSPHPMMHMSGGPHPGELMPPPHMPHSHHHPPPPHLIPQQQPPPNHGQMSLHHNRGESPPMGPAPLLPGLSRATDTPPSEETSNEKKPLDNLRPRVQPSPYCDFCLGDAAENKKSGVPEELVSCSDCGRSGHPTCLQFTANMIISVKKYRWQCIECKCCSICGTSDNDDQLLFCDDCDRGYHMYCLMPPLDAPPEGSWSCTLCLAEFHQK